MGREERLCFSGPNALCDTRGVFGGGVDASSPEGRDSSRTSLHQLTVHGMTSLQMACFAEDCVRLSRCIENRLTHFSAHRNSLFPPPLSICCLWKCHEHHSTRANVPEDDEEEEEKGSRKISFGSLACAEALLLHDADPEALCDPLIERLRVGTVTATTADGAEQESLNRSQSSLSVQSAAALTAVSIRPLHLALLNNNTSLVKLLLKHGATVRPLHHAALHASCCSWSIGGLAMVAHMDDEAVRAAASERLDACQRTAMHVALLHYPRDDYAMPNDDVCEHGDRLLYLLDMLAFYGCDVDAQDEVGSTALHEAWRFGCADAAVHLIERLHASTTLLDNTGATAFQVHPSGLPSAAVLLGGLARDAHVSPSWHHLERLIAAVLRHDPHAVMTQKAQGSSDDKSTDTYASETTEAPLTGIATALHVLCESFGALQHLYPTDRLVALAEALLLHSPRCVNMCDEVGLTPLFLACSSSMCSKAFINVLLAHGADPWMRCCDRKKLGQAGSEVTCLQQLLALPEPYSGIGDVALSLIEAIGNFDLNDLSQPYQPSRPFMESTTVRTHPYWQSFFEVICPPETEKEKRKREAERFYAYASLGRSNGSVLPQQTMVGEVSSVLSNSIVKQRTPPQQESSGGAAVSSSSFLRSTFIHAVEQRKAEENHEERGERDVTAQLPAAVVSAVAMFRLEDLNTARFVLEQDRATRAAQCGEDDELRREDLMFPTVPQSGTSSVEDEQKDLPILVQFLREREAEEAFRRRCWEDPYAVEEMRRQHMRALSFAAERHSGLLQLVDYHQYRSGGDRKSVV